MSRKVKSVTELQPQIIERSWQQLTGVRPERLSKLTMGRHRSIYYSNIDIQAINGLASSVSSTKWQNFVFLRWAKVTKTVTSRCDVRTRNTSKCVCLWLRPS